MSFEIHQYWVEAFEDFGELYRIRDHFDLINGYPFKSEHFNNDGNGKPLVRIRDILSESLPTYFDGKEGMETVVQDGDIVIGMDGDFNAVTWSKGEALLNQRVCALRTRDYSDIDPRILGYQIPISLKIINDLTPSSTVKHLSSLDVLSLKLPRFNQNTQATIADYLDQETVRIDGLVEKKQRQIEILKEKIQSQTTNLVIQGIEPSSTRLIGPEWLPEIPQSWDVQRIATLFDESQEMGGGDDLPILSVSINWGISDKELGDEDRHRIVSHIEDRNAYKRVRPGDLVYNMMRAWQGAFGVARVDGLVSPAYVVARPKENIHSPYFEALLRTPMCIEEFRRNSKGIADFRQRLYWENFKQVRVVLPKLNEQIEIATEIERRTKRLEQLIVPIEKSIDLLHEKRAALITAAVTGQLNISNNETSADNVIPFTTRIAAQIIYHHRNTQRFGRVKFQKALYLAEAHAGISELQGEYERRAAGPLDQGLLNRLEAGLQDAQLYAAQSADSGEQIEYTLLAGAGDQRDALKSELGARADGFYHILDKLTDLSTKNAEAVATLYAVWNDALIDGKTPDDARIIHGVFEEWHPEKKEKFRKDELETWLGWMRRNGFTPKGTGPRTTLGRLLV